MADVIANKNGLTNVYNILLTPCYAHKPTQTYVLEAACAKC